MNTKLHEGYSENGNATHYEQQRIKAINKYERIYGTLGVMVFCEITANRYRDRLGHKAGQPIEQELVKARWYENAAAFYFKRLGTSQEVKVDNHKKEGYPWEPEIAKARPRPSMEPLTSMPKEETTQEAAEVRNWLAEIYNQEREEELAKKYGVKAGSMTAQDMAAIYRVENRIK